MQFKWLKQNSKDEKYKKLIVFFCGWGLDERVIKHLLVNDKCEQYDVLFINDYRDLSLDSSLLTSNAFSCYQERILIAWSFGVAAASTYLSMCLDKGLDVQFDKRIAINGSMQPVNRRLGIVDIVMQKTIDTLSQHSFELFSQRCYSKKCYDEQLFDPINIDVQARKEELESIQIRKHRDISGWDIVWLGNQDKIFPFANLSRAWQAYNLCQSGLQKHNTQHTTHTNTPTHQHTTKKNDLKQDTDRQAIIKVIDAPHAPFKQWKYWHDMVL